MIHDHERRNTRAASRRVRCGWLALALLIVSGCSSSVDVRTARSPGARFDGYRTVAFELDRAAPGEYTSSPQSAAVVHEVFDAAADTLRTRGYTLVDGDRADVIFRLQAGRRERGLVITVSPIPIVFGGVQPEYYRQFEHDGDDLMDGIFIVDSFDRRTHALVWRATAETLITPGQIDHVRLRKAVQAAFGAFPAYVGR